MNRSKELHQLWKDKVSLLEAARRIEVTALTVEEITLTTANEADFTPSDHGQEVPK